MCVRFKNMCLCRQALKQETEVLWFEFELQSSQVSQQQSAEGGGLEGDSEGANLLQQWRGQQICLQTRSSHSFKLI